MNLNEELLKLLNSEEEMKYELARRHLMDYTQIQAPYYRTARHNIAIANALEKVERGETRRLMIFAPPRHGKSLLSSEMFPAYYLGKHPDRYIIHATYSKELAEDFGSKIRNQITREPFNTIFPNCNTTGMSKSQSKISTTEGGAYFAVGVGGALTGRGAHLLIIDDPIKGYEEATSEVLRKKMKDWFRTVAYTRLMPGGSIVIIQTRWHSDDLAGWLLEQDKDKKEWETLILRAEAEEDDPLGRKVGEALWPSDFPLSELKKTKELIGSKDYDCLYQQHATSDDTGEIRLSWFSRYYNGMRRSDFDFVVQSWDTATDTNSRNDFSVMHTWGVNSRGFFLINHFSGKLQFVDLCRAVTSFYNAERPNVVLIENKGSGASLIQTLRRSYLNIKPMTPIKDKVLRARNVAPIIESGKCFLPVLKTGELDEFEKEIREFPAGKHDDEIDAMTQALNYLDQRNFTGRKKEKYDLDKAIRLMPSIYSV